MKFFIINGHKYYPFAQGRLNKTLFDEIKKILIENKNEIKTTIIEQGYNVDEEIKKYKWADIIIFQTPVNWFSVPWIMKKYFDYIYRYGEFYTGSAEYGKGGLLNGKRYMYSLTCNPKSEDFDNPEGFFEGKSIEDLIVALHKMQQFCGLSPIKTFCAYDVVHNPDIPFYLKSLKNHINTYVLNTYIS